MLDEELGRVCAVAVLTLSLSLSLSPSFYLSLSLALSPPRSLSASLCISLSFSISVAECPPCIIRFIHGLNVFFGISNVSLSLSGSICILAV